MSSLLPTPSNIIKQADHIIFTFLWQGKDMVTRLSGINTLKEGGIKMIDIESMILKSLKTGLVERNI